jgi:hypothetical protein
MEIRDFILARAAAARTSAKTILDLLDDNIMGAIVEPEEMSAKKFKEEIVATVEAATDESGLLSRALEVIAHMLEQTDPATLKEGEPDYDSIIATEDEGDAA